jgi:hypothetical protein
VLREDGSKRVVLRRGFLTRRAAAATLRAEIRKTETGQWVQPSTQALSAYLGEWLDGQRLAQATLASYRKNIRLHVGPYLGVTPLDRGGPSPPAAHACTPDPDTLPGSWFR